MIGLPDNSQDSDNDFLLSEVKPSDLMTEVVIFSPYIECFNIYMVAIII